MGNDLSGRPVSDFAPSSSFHGPPEFWLTTAPEARRSTNSLHCCHLPFLICRFAQFSRVKHQKEVSPLR
jgi:hypothetical protein